jgi:hypothetical protein
VTFRDLRNRTRTRLRKLGLDVPKATVPCDHHRMHLAKWHKPIQVMDCYDCEYREWHQLDPVSAALLDDVNKTHYGD